MQEVRYRQTVGVLRGHQAPAFRSVLQNVRENALAPLQHRLEGCRQMIARLQSDGDLRDGLDPSSAADLLWTLTSLRLWEDLVLERGWSSRRYQKHVLCLLLAALTKG